MNPSPPIADAWTGRLVGGRWRILSLLDDSGGMASVYLAQDEQLPRTAVVKIPKGAALNDEFRSRFARESRLHAQVSDRNVVQVLDGGEEADTPYLVLRYLPGGNLKAWCDRNPSILADPRLHYESWLLPIAQALDAVAAQGIIHRDVKPTNILFDSGGQAYLSDFGIVKGQDEGTLAKTGMLIGTLQFMSPEQCHEEKRHTLDGRSDQYGLAVTAYQVLTGWNYPVADDTGVIYAAKFGLSPMKEPRDHDPRIPQPVNDAVMRALAADREQRFGSCVEFAKAVLGAFKRAPPPPPPPPPPRRSPLLRVVGGLATVAAAGAILWWSLSESESEVGPEPRPSAPVVGASSPAIPTQPTPSVTPRAPRVTAVRLAAAGPFKAGDDVEIEITFSRPVRVTGQPRIEFSVGGESTRREAVFVGGDGTVRLSFLFEVPTGSADGTGITLAAPPSIDTADAAIADAATGEAADLAIEPPAAFAAVRIDGVAPRVVSVEPPQGTADRRTGDQLEFRVTFDEPVTVEGLATVQFDDGEVTRFAEFAGMAGPRTLRFTSIVRVNYTVRHGVEMQGLILGSGLTAAGSICDTAGNPANLEFAATNSAPFTINPERPTVPSAGLDFEVVENSLGIKLVRIPPGKFEMGSNESDDEKPIHEVKITRPFLLGRTEVTLGQFFEFYADGYEGQLDCERDGKGGWGYDAATMKTEQKPRYSPWSWGHPDIDITREPSRQAAFRHPVVNVSWNDAVAFCEWLSRKEGKRYRLPTEAEWEYACRAGSTTRYWTGDDPESLAASENIADDTAKTTFSGWATIRGRDGHVFTAPVGSYRTRNLFGLSDMQGNVAEWCSDWYAEDEYLPSPGGKGFRPRVDPGGPPTGSFRVIRGGGWSYEAGSCRSAHRGGFPASTRDFNIGFRVACDVE